MHEGRRKPVSRADKNLKDEGKLLKIITFHKPAVWLNIKPCAGVHASLQTICIHLFIIQSSDTISNLKTNAEN